MKQLRWIVAGAALVSLACGGLDTEEPAPAPAVEAVAVEFGENEDPVAAYRESCAAIQTRYDDMSGGQTPACEWIEFDQMCADDPSGCFDKGEACKDTCGDPCETCEATCVMGCSTCKDRCGDDEGCLTECAVDRYACQESCVEQRDQCFTACGEQNTACYNDFEAKLAEVCPQCDEITECMSAALFGEEGASFEACEARFASADPRCMAWCPAGH